MEIKLPYQLTISIESMAKFPLEKNTALWERGVDRARYYLMIMFCKFRAKTYLRHFPRGMVGQDPRSIGYGYNSINMITNNLTF